jgi:hypothetical protein
MQKLQLRKGITPSPLTENAVAGLNLGGPHKTLAITTGSQYALQVTTSTATFPSANDYPLTNKGQKTTIWWNSSEDKPKYEKKQGDNKALLYSRHLSG